MCIQVWLSLYPSMSALPFLPPPFLPLPLSTATPHDQLENQLEEALVQNVKVVASTLATGSQAAGRGSGRPGRKRAKTGGVTVAVSGTIKQPEQAIADISMLPPSSE